MIHAMIIYPLSHAFQQQLESTYQNPIHYLSLTKLRQHSFWQIIKLLRKLNTEKLLIPLEDSNSEILLPILLVVAILVKKQRLEIVYPNLQREIVSVSKTVKSIIGFIYSSLASYVGFLNSRQQIKQLLKAPRLSPVTKVSKNVLYLNANLWFGVKAGGSVGHIAGVINALQKNHAVHYASVDKNGLIAPEVAFTLLSTPQTFGIPPELNYYRFNTRIYNQLTQTFANAPFKFIYQRMSIANYTGVLLARHFKVPLILEYNGSEIWVAKNWGRQLRYADTALMAEEVCLQQAHLIVTISDVLREELIQRGVEPERIVCYPNCIDPHIFDPARFTPEQQLAVRQQHNIAPDAIVLTFVGTFGAWHGVDKLAEAIRYMIDNHASWLNQHKVHWLLVGDGVKMEEVKKILCQNDDKPFVTTTGLIPQHEAPSYLAASDILLSPHVANADGSRFFGSPTKLFEYMAMGKGIIASDLEQIGEILQHSLRANELPTELPTIKNSELAVLCEPGNVTELVKAIRFLVENRSWRDTLGNNSKKEALEKYTWQQHVDIFLKKLSA